MKFTFYFGAIAVLATFTACSSVQTSSGTTDNFVASPSNVHQQRPRARLKSKPATLYILDDEDGAGVVRVYKNGGSSPLRSVLPDTYGQPVSFAVDAAGSLYMSAYNQQAKQKQRGILYVYTSRGSKLVRTLLQRSEFGFLTPDEAGNLYSICPGRRICEFPGGEEPASRKLKGFGAPLATDATGDLAGYRCAAAQSEACVFAPGAESPYWTISSGVNYPYMNGFIFDPQGNLYAANRGDETTANPGNIAVYAPTESSPSRVISTGIAGPLAVVIDTQGNLYVYNQCAGSYNSQHVCSTPGGAVTVYAPGASTPSRTITNGISGFVGHPDWISGIPLAVDDAGYVYVVDGGAFGSGDVTVYKPGAKNPTRTITDLQGPVAVSVGP